MGGTPAVAGEIWLSVCERLNWDMHVAFELKHAIEEAYPPPEKPGD